MSILPNLDQSGKIFPRPVLYPENVPAEMIALDQWNNWRYESNGRSAEPAKVPRQPALGNKARSNDPHTWTTFAAVVAAYKRTNRSKQGDYSGIGWMFSANDGMCGLDLDDCFDGDELQDWAREIVEQFCNTYIEMTPSNRGLRIFCYGSPIETGQRKGLVPGRPKSGFEIYDYTSPRFLTVTGNKVFGCKGLTDCQHQLDTLWEQYWGDTDALDCSPRAEITGADLPSIEEIDLALQYIDVRRFDADYAGWINVGQSIFAGGGTWEQWDRWSRQSDAYDEGICEKKWRTMNPVSITHRTLFAWANKNPKFKSALKLLRQKSWLRKLERMTPPETPTTITSDMTPPETPDMTPKVEHSQWRGKGGLPPHFRLADEGLLKCSAEKPYGEWVAGPIYPIAVTSAPNGNGGGGIVLEFLDIDGRLHEIAIPRTRLADEPRELIRELATYNFQWKPGRAKDLIDFIAMCTPHERRISVRQTGWVDDPKLVYVMPMAATADGYQFQPEQHAPTTKSMVAKGTLADWKREVAQRVRDHDLLLFSLCTAFAGPLVKYSRRNESFIMHLHGSTSSGKTTALQVGASVWGNGAEPREESSYIRTWNATANAQEANCAAHNDCLMASDEIGTNNVKDFGKLVYDTQAGQGKGAMDANRNLKPSRHWRFVVLSSGEKSTKQMIEESSHAPAKGGQLNRMLDVPISAIPSGLTAQPIEEIKQACRSNYGHAGFEFVTRIANEFGTGDEFESAITAQLDNAIEVLPKADEQEKSRALKHFGLVLAAGILAQELLDLPIAPIRIQTAIQNVANAWLSNVQTSSEVERGMSAVNDFLLKHRESKFKHLGLIRKVVNEDGEKEYAADDPRLQIIDLVGYWHHAQERYYLTDEGFKTACRGFDHEQIALALKKHGFLSCNEAPKLRSRFKTGNGEERIRGYAIDESIHAGLSTLSTEKI